MGLHMKVSGKMVCSTEKGSLRGPNNKMWYEGMWAEGKENGYGVLTVDNSNEIQYRGYWRNGKYEGVKMDEKTDKAK